MLARLAAQYGFEGRWCYCARFYFPKETVGLTYRRMCELYREADAILNVCGAQELNEDLLQSDRLIYVESDPGRELIEIDQGLETRLEYMRRHRAFFTFGENVGTPEFPVPTHGFQWQTTRQPIVTDLWQTDAPPPAGALFTSVANWNTSGLKDIEWRGEKYLWSKSLEFLKFAEAPMRAGEPFELATNLRDQPTIDHLKKLDWRLVAPDQISIDHRSLPRLSAKLQGRVHGGEGSIRAAQYRMVLGSLGVLPGRGRPVITQETGFTRYYGGGRGLFAFRTLDEIAEAVREINADYALHSKAAREIAMEYFEATTVLRALLEKAGV